MYLKKEKMLEYVDRLNKPIDENTDLLDRLYASQELIRDHRERILAIQTLVDRELERHKRLSLLHRQSILQDRLLDIFKNENIDSLEKNILKTGVLIERAQNFSIRYKADREKGKMYYVVDDNDESSHTANS